MKCHGNSRCAGAVLVVLVLVGPGRGVSAACDLQVENMWHPDLECSCVALNAWSLLRQQSIEMLNLWREDTEAVPSVELEELSRELITTHRANAEELYSHFWADRDDPDPWPFKHYCILGHVTAFYLLAWVASSQGDVVQAEYYLMSAISMLRMDDHDLFEHTSWPFTSFDILSNLFFLRRGWPFQGMHLKPDADTGHTIRQRLPLMWPPYAPRCWPCPETLKGQLKDLKAFSRQRLKVWWTSKNPGPFVDFATILENWMNDRYEVEVSHNALADHCEYARYKNWLCSKDMRFKEVLEEQRISTQASQMDCGERGQWCGLRELHQEFDDKVIPRFKQLFHELRDVDLFACGHPLYWCRLVMDFNAPVLGIWDMTHQFSVPEDLQEHWTAEFLLFFQQKQNLLVAMSAYHSFQVHWLLGLRVPYFQPVTPDVSLGARYSPHVRPNEVVVSKFRTPYDIELLRKFLEEAKMAKTAALPGLPFRFVAWEDMPCGQDCSKAELGRFRASVLSAYDTSPMKLTEFYAMSIPICIFSGGLWRTAMRWAKADAKSGGLNATRPGRDFGVFGDPEDPDDSKDWQWIQRALKKETEEILWEEPWHPRPKGPKVHKLQEDQEGPPFDDLPYSPFMENRAELVTPGAAFWVQLTDWALLPHLLRYESASHLLQMLSDLSLDDLLEVSRRMASHYTKLLVASTNFWRALIMSLVEDRDSSIWKG